MNKKDYFAPCAICGKPVYKPIFDVWPWKYTKDRKSKTYWFCGEKHKLQEINFEDVKWERINEGK